VTFTASGLEVALRFLQAITIGGNRALKSLLSLLATSIFLGRCRISNNFPSFA